MGVGDDVAPRFSQKPVIKQEDGGKKLLFHCVLEASPEPDIKWFRGTDPVTETDRIKIKTASSGPSSYNVDLEITGVTPADAASYKVTAKNKLGESSASINLNFGGEYTIIVHIHYLLMDQTQKSSWCLV